MAISLDDFFIEKNKRADQRAVFCRIAGYNGDVERFLRRFYDEARREGAVIIGKLPNPDERNLEYYEEIMGLEFQMNPGFIGEKLKKWMPRLAAGQRQTISMAIYDVLDGMRCQGKNDNMLKNAYIKFMCWMYYKFERVLGRLGNPHPPKILHEGDVAAYELSMLSILNRAGCDIVILEFAGDGAYQKLDPSSELSVLAPCEGPFPAGFSVKSFQPAVTAQPKVPPRPPAAAQPKAPPRPPAAAQPKTPPRPNPPMAFQTAFHPCTNGWIVGDVLENAAKDQAARGIESGFYKNVFVLMRGVDDKAAYLSDLYEFYSKISSRKHAVVNGGLEKPTVDEINRIQRENYAGAGQMAAGLVKNIVYAENNEIQQEMRSSFVQILEEYGEAMPLNKLLYSAVYLLCWLNRYQYALFKGMKLPDAAVFIYFGACADQSEAMFLKLLSRLPVDVLVFCPSLEKQSVLADKMLFEKTYDNSMELQKFPVDPADIRMGTTAFHAERELDSMLYSDTGLYRNMQHTAAAAITLETMYEEIALLWPQELKYRQGFHVIGGEVTMPVIFAKISGVKDGNEGAYWQSVRRLLTEDTVLITKAPFITGRETNMIKPLATEFLKNGRLQREKIKRSRAFQFGYLREQMQDYILDKIQLLIDSRIIEGTFQSGMEYAIVSTTLNMNREIARLIQKFDFTKGAPKVVLVNTSEAMYSREDAIMLAFLNRIGFDIAIFTPTGYQSVERDYTQKIMNEYQIGEYMYDLHTPDLKSDSMLQSLKEKFFRKGN